MTALWLVVLGLVALGTVLAIAESSLSRINRARAATLRAAGRRHAELLERIESDPPRHLNSVYLAVMLVQNGSAILAALAAGRQFDDAGVAVAMAAFTLGYFVVVEAMGKTYGIQNAERAALFLAPLVWGLSRLLAWPTRALIGIANVLLPGRGLKEGPFVSEAAIRALAEVGHREGSIETSERDLIHSVFRFADATVREVMTPRPDIVAVAAGDPLASVPDLLARTGHSRLPVHRGEIDDAIGLLDARDVLKSVRPGQPAASIEDLVRPVRFVPETKLVAHLLREMQADSFRFALVVDEHGSVVGLVTLEDVLEQLVGELSPEGAPERRAIVEVAPGTWSVSGRTSVAELGDRLGVELPREHWDTVAGLVLGLVGGIPREGQMVDLDSVRFVAERVRGRRITRVRVERLAGARGSSPAGPAA